MYAIRRTIAAFVLGAMLFGAPVVVAHQVPTLAQVLAAGNAVPDDGTIQGPLGSSVTFSANGSILVSSNTGGQVLVDSDGSVQLLVSGGGGFLLIDADGNVAISGMRISLLNLPTSDPAVAGALYSDNGTVKVSAG